jgi:hypothetical protein
MTQQTNTVWLCKGRLVTDKLSPYRSKTVYYFIQPKQPEDQSSQLVKGETALYSQSLGNFITTEDPGAALMIQQLLNDGALTVRPRTPETL